MRVWESNLQSHHLRRKVFYINYMSNHYVNQWCSSQIQTCIPRLNELNEQYHYLSFILWGSNDDEFSTIQKALPMPPMPPLPKCCHVSLVRHTWEMIYILLTTFLHTYYPRKDEFILKSHKVCNILTLFPCRQYILYNFTIHSFISTKWKANMLSICANDSNTIYQYPCHLSIQP